MIRHPPRSTPFPYPDALPICQRTFDFFERSSTWDAAPERFRLHGVATQRAADRLATETGYDNRDRLMVTALLHDIGKLVLKIGKSTRLNSSHANISYAVFCLK